MDAESKINDADDFDIFDHVDEKRNVTCNADLLFMAIGVVKSDAERLNCKWMLELTKKLKDSIKEVD